MGKNRKRTMKLKKIQNKGRSITPFEVSRNMNNMTTGGVTVCVMRESMNIKGKKLTIFLDSQAEQF